jgi:hypothetical protein
VKASGLCVYPICEIYSEKFKSIQNRYNIRKIFKTKHKFKRSLMKSRQERDPQQTAQCVCSIPCECGRSYFGETGRPLAMRLPEHRQSLKESLLEKSKLAQHAYEDGHNVGWDEARILEIESNGRYRKYKELAHMSCLINRSTNPIWTFIPSGSPLIINEVSSSQRRSVCCADSSWVL